MKKACIVGYGAIAPTHAAAIKKSRFGELYAVCDSNPAALLKSSNCGAKVFYKDISQAVEDDLIDVLHICTPHYLHKEMVIRALRSGKDVVLEKPAVISKKELDEVISTRNNTKRHICYMLQNRTNVCVVKLKEIIDTGIYGNVIGVFGSLTWNRNSRYYTSSDWKGTFAREGGSLLSNQSIHLIDMLSFLCKGIKSVQAELSVTKLSDVIETEDTAYIFLRFGNGASGCMFATNAYSYDEPYRIEIRFEKGLVLYTNGYLLDMTSAQPTVITSDQNNSAGKSCWGAGHAAVTEQFYTFLEKGIGSYISIDDGSNSLNAIFDIYNNSKITRPPEIIL